MAFCFLRECLVIVTVIGFAEATVSTEDIKTGLSVAKDLSDFIAKRDFSQTLSHLAGAIGPYLGVIGPVFGLITGLLAGNQESPKLAFMKSMMKHIDSRFDHVDNEFADLTRKIDHVHTQILFGTVENNVHSVSVSLQEFYGAPANAVNGSKRYFISTYDQNYNGAAQKIYDGFILDNNLFSQNLATSAMTYSQNDRHNVQTFILGLLKLLLQAVKIELAYLKAMGETDGVIEYRQKLWQTKILRFKSKMGSIDQTIVSNYLTQTDTDLERIASENTRLTNEDFANKLYNFLITKYFWRDWLVIVYDDIYGAQHHYIHTCNGYLKLRFHGRNLVVSSVDKRLGTRPVAEKNSILSALQLTIPFGKMKLPHGDAHVAYNSFPANVRDRCYPYASVGVIRTGHHLYYKGLASRLTIKNEALFSLYMFD